MDDNHGVMLAFDNRGVNRQPGRMLEKTGQAGGRGRGQRRSADERRGEAIADLMLEVAQCFFRIRAVGQKAGLLTSWGGGAYGFLRSLANLGPLTVPQIAQMRPTSRQRMQRLADELAAEGLVAFVENPKHRRSKLVRLTPEGEARYRELSGRLLEIASAVSTGFDEEEVRRSAELLRRLSEQLGTPPNESGAPTER